MISYKDHLQELPRIKGVYQEKIRLKSTFEQTTESFSSDRGTVLLLSGSNSDASQYHILAVKPWLELTSRQGKVDVFCQSKHQSIDGDVFEVLSDIIGRYSLDEAQFDLPIHAGLFGYLAYDLKDRIEKLPITCKDTYLPDVALYAPSVIFIHDKHSEDTHLLIPYFDEKRSMDDQLREKRSWFYEKLNTPTDPKAFYVDGRGFKSSFSKNEYVDAVNQIIEYLKAGDIYQANLSQRFEAGFNGDAYSLFLDLYERNPAAFFSYINAGDHTIVSTSPERFIQQKGKNVETRPIKGTIARGENKEQDLKNRQTLGESVKDDAELTMIVDLMRNDLSRVTQHESVVVKEHKRLEPYENVFHLVSIVEGELKDDKTSIDLIKATFPGGSITGCPKIRSMEIIDELESVKRHVYTGSIGYISFHQTMDLSIAIRTATIMNNRIWFSVGGGIVYDSDPEKEFQETLDKGKTLMEALSGNCKIKANPKPVAWVNGKIVDQDEVSIPCTSTGFQYGAGVFETIKVIKGSILRLDNHVSRLNRSWQDLFETPAPDITWKPVIDAIVTQNGLQDKIAVVKIIVSQDESDGNPSHFLTVFAKEYTHRLTVLGKSGLDLVTYPHSRLTPLADYKSMNYLYYYQAGQYAKNHSGDEAIILNPDGTVSETNTANILAFDNHHLIVPSSDHVLQGTAMNAVLDLLSEQGYELIHRPVLKDELFDFTDIILTNALMGAVKVLTIDGKKIKNNQDVCSLINKNLFNPN